MHLVLVDFDVSEGPVVRSAVPSVPFGAENLAASAFPAGVHELPIFSDSFPIVVPSYAVHQCTAELTTAHGVTQCLSSTPLHASIRGANLICCSARGEEVFRLPATDLEAKDTDILAYTEEGVFRITMQDPSVMPSILSAAEHAAQFFEGAPRLEFSHWGHFVVKTVPHPEAPRGSFTFGLVVCSPVYNSFKEHSAQLTEFLSTVSNPADITDEQMASWHAQLKTQRYASVPEFLRSTSSGSCESELTSPGNVQDLIQWLGIPAASALLSALLCQVSVLIPCGLSDRHFRHAIHWLAPFSNAMSYLFVDFDDGSGISISFPNASQRIVLHPQKKAKSFNTDYNIVSRASRGSEAFARRVFLQYSEYVYSSGSSAFPLENTHIGSAQHARHRLLQGTQSFTLVNDYFLQYSENEVALMRGLVELELMGVGEGPQACVNLVLADVFSRIVRALEAEEVVHVVLERCPLCLGGLSTIAAALLSVDETVRQLAARALKIIESDEKGEVLVRDLNNFLVLSYNRDQSA